MPDSQPFPLRNVEIQLVGTRCLECLHLTDLVEGTCRAFPDRIPAELMQDLILHDRPYPGDRGFCYEPAPGRRGGTS